MKQNIEFRDSAHFRDNYQRHFPGESLARFIDFFWETDFDETLGIYPEGFSDVLFPNTGYTYIINLGSPFVMQVNHDRFNISGNSDNFLPRHQCIECFHAQGCRIFGIKFRISPILLEKKVNFSEYRTSMNPLSYLIDRSVIKNVRSAENFLQRVDILKAYFLQLIENYELPGYVSVVTEVLKEFATRGYNIPVDDLASNHNISARTLQRYFEQSMSLGTKQTLQILRMRHAIESLISGSGFDISEYGYYDQSHFIRHLKKFATPKRFDEIYNFLKKS